jgi:hypothetical protein
MQYADMKRSVSLAVAALAIFFLTGFGAKPKTFRQGYGDGYAVGYNTTCKVRGTHFYGDWDSGAYKRGYAAGLRAGVRACFRGAPEREYIRRYRW